MLNEKIRVLIVADHASLKYGGEAALPFHYFRVLRKRNVETWLIVHERTRKELEYSFPNDKDRIYFVHDNLLYRSTWQLRKLFPRRLYEITFALILKLISQLDQRKIAKRLIREKQIDIIHQPIPVSPKEPSLFYNMGVPVIIGPMNGGMEYPSWFKKKQKKLYDRITKINRYFANLANFLIPGKCQATILLVANSRTRQSLPSIIKEPKIIELVENGVDLSLWKNESNDEKSTKQTSIPKFVYIGRLIDWKGVNFLLIALKKAIEITPMVLYIIGDGEERCNLEKQVSDLHLNNNVRFLGHLSQPKCAEQLQDSSGLILPSCYECGGSVVLEAMAMKIPVIASKWGGMIDYLDDSCGFLVEISSYEQFIDGLVYSMVKLAKNAHLRSTMGKAGCEKVKQHFDWEKKVDRIFEIYQDAIKSKKNEQS